ncbi:MAG: hypothetical protein GC154_17675 [bacterium]|nr:hypothetical protein [bacterium]
MLTSILAMMILTAAPNVIIERPSVLSVDVPVRAHAEAPAFSADAHDWFVNLDDDGTPSVELPLAVQRSKAFPDDLFFILPAGYGQNENTLHMKEKRGALREPRFNDWFSFDDDGDGHLRINCGRPIMTYIYGMQLPDGVPEDRTRSTYVHPIHGIDGEVLTDDFPKDHYHHRGLHWAWPSVYVNDVKFDLWTIYGIHQKFEKWLYREAGPVCALLGVQNGWYIDERRVIDETVEFVVYRPNGVGQAIDVKVTLKAVESPVTIQGTETEQKGYGGMNLRFSPREDTAITTAGGMRAKDALMFPSWWADLSARFQPQPASGSRTSGVAVLISPDHPENPKGSVDSEGKPMPPLPPGWILRHYGFLGVSWPGLAKYTLSQGDDPLVLKYRLWIHRGGAESGKVDEADKAYRERIEVKFE